MASGANVPISGGTDMQQVVPGDTIQSADFNEARTNINTMLSAPTSVTDVRGLNQGGVAVGSAVPGATVYALGAAGAFTDLQDDIQAINNFYDASTRAPIVNDITVGQIIDADEWNALMLDTKDRWDGGVKIYSNSTKSFPASDTWVNATDGDWTGLLTSTVTFTWSNTADMNSFFNAGGAVGLVADLPGYTQGSGTDQDDAWDDKLTALNEVAVAKLQNIAGAGTIQGTGQVGMTTSYSGIVSYNGGASPYLDDWANVTAKVNNTTSPTSITVRIILNDGEDGHPPSDAPVTVDTRVRALLMSPDTNGSGFSFATPTTTQTPLVQT